MSIGTGVFPIMIAFNSLKFIPFLFIGILFFKDWTFAKTMEGRGGLVGRFLSRFRTPPRLPLFLFLLGISTFIVGAGGSVVGRKAIS